ncbi:MAG: response regulator [Candidatus Omnitrophota bacterium]
MEESLLKVNDVMRRLNVARRTVYSWIQEGILKSVQIGGLHRFHAAEIERLANFGHDELPGKRKRILAIDDDILVRESLKIFLKRAGYSVTVVPDGPAAVAMAREKDFDLTLTDMRMPGMDGLETLKAIRQARKDSGKESWPEIIMTAYEDSNAKAEAAAIGVRKFVMKPFEIEALLDIIRKSIA